MRISGLKGSGMAILTTIFFGFLGMAVGSFLNVCIDRLPAGKSLLRPGSYCDCCRHPLEWRDLIPILSYLWLRGKCRFCGATIHLRVVFVEIGAGAVFALLFWYFGLTWPFPLYAFYLCLLLVIAVIDLNHHLILNILVYPGAAIALIVDIFQPQIGIFNGLIGGGIGLVILLIPAFISRGGMGWGDVKMAGMLGLMTGFPEVFVAILGGVILGGLIAVILLLAGKRSRKEAIPFGPFLALGAVLALFAGHQIVNWYLGLFQ